MTRDELNFVSSNEEHNLKIELETLQDVAVDDGRLALVLESGEKWNLEFDEAAIAKRIYDLSKQLRELGPPSKP